MGASKMYKQMQNIVMTKMMTSFPISQQATNFSIVKIELVPILHDVTVTKRSIRNP